MVFVACTILLIENKELAKVSSADLNLPIQNVNIIPCTACFVITEYVLEIAQQNGINGSPLLSVKRVYHRAAFEELNFWLFLLTCLFRSTLYLSTVYFSQV